MSSVIICCGIADAVRYNSLQVLIGCVTRAIVRHLSSTERLVIIFFLKRYFAPEFPEVMLPAFSILFGPEFLQTLFAPVCDKLPDAIPAATGTLEGRYRILRRSHCSHHY